MLPTSGMYCNKGRYMDTAVEYKINKDSKENPGDILNN